MPDLSTFGNPPAGAHQQLTGQARPGSPPDLLSRMTVSCGAHCQLSVEGSGNRLYVQDHSEVHLWASDNILELKDRLPAACPPLPDIQIPDCGGVTLGTF